MKDILVTGANGFIGKALVENLKNRYPNSKIFSPNSNELNLANYAEVNNYFERISWSNTITHIFHIAALYKAGGWPVDHPATQFYVNMAININFFENCKKYFSQSKVTSVLSYCIYPDHDKPHPESEVFFSEPEDYLYAYAFTKKAIIIANRAYKQEFGMSLTSVVLPTVYGPGDSVAENSHVMGALIGKFINAKKNGIESVEIWGDGYQEREFLFINDATDGIIEASLNSNELFLNLGTNECHKIKDVAELIINKLNYSGTINYNTTRFTGAKKRLMDSTKLNQILKWKPSVSMKEGIETTINFYYN